MKKLHVPAPGKKHEDPLALYDPLAFAIALCLFLAIGSAILLATSTDKTPDSNRTKPTIAENTVDFNKIEQALKEFENLGPEKLRQFAWTPTTAAAAWQYSSRDSAEAVQAARNAAEAACEHYAPALTSGELDPTLVNSLTNSLERHTLTAPWTCLSRLLLNEQLPQENTELYNTLEHTWQTIEAFEGHGEIAASVVDNFQTSRNRPESPRFYRWLRLCAFQFTEDAYTSYPAAMACHKLLHQISPLQGEDFIMAADRIWAESPTQTERHSIIRAFNILGRKGQPYAWRTDETPSIHDYNTDFRVGIVFSLCRILHSPDHTDAIHAAAAIASIAGSSIRPADVNLLYRWRKTCRFAFLPRDANPDDAMPLLHITTPSDEQPAEEQSAEDQSAEDQSAQEPKLPHNAHDYTLASLINRGECTKYQDKPDWYCGAERWRGGRKTIADALGDWYNDTRYVEWRD